MWNSDIASCAFSKQQLHTLGVKFLLCFQFSALEMFTNFPFSPGWMAGSVYFH